MQALINNNLLPASVSLLLLQQQHEQEHGGCVAADLTAIYYRKTVVHGIAVVKSAFNKRCTNDVSRIKVKNRADATKITNVVDCLLYTSDAADE